MILKEYVVDFGILIMFCLENKSVCKGGFVFVIITEIFNFQFMGPIFQIKFSEVP